MLFSSATAACITRLAAAALRPLARHHRQAASAALIRFFKIAIRVSFSFWLLAFVIVIY